MPFTFPEEANDLIGKHQRSLVKVSRALRLGMADPGMAYDQWVPTLQTIMPFDVFRQFKEFMQKRRRESKAPTGFFGRLVRAAAVYLGRANSESDDLARLCIGMERRIREKASEQGGGGGGGGRRALSLDEMLYRKYRLCKGCHLLNKELVLGRIDMEKSLLQWSLAIGANTNASDLIILTMLCAVAIAILVGHRQDEEMSDQRAWRLECITRLHIGNLIHTHYSLSSGGFAPPFEVWYMHAFHPLVEWETMAGGNTIARASFVEPMVPEIKGMFAMPTGDEEIWPNILALSETVKRISEMVEMHRYAWDTMWGFSDQADSSAAKYYQFSRTMEMMAISQNGSIPWPPVCVTFGLPGQVLLDRLRISSQVTSLKIEKSPATRKTNRARVFFSGPLFLE